MSTRATYQFRDDRTDVTVYKHHDGYPEGAYQWIARALSQAWPLPRWEADDFAAAFVAANKGEGGGGVYIGSTRDEHGDTEYHYIVTYKEGAIHVTRQEPDGWDDDRTWGNVESGTLDEMLDKYSPKREWVTAD